MELRAINGDGDVGSNRADVETVSRPQDYFPDPDFSGVWGLIAVEHRCSAQKLMEAGSWLVVVTWWGRGA